MNFASNYAFIGGDEAEEDDSLNVAEDELESGLEANLAIPAMDSAPLGAPPPAAAPLAMAGLQMGAAGAAVQQQQGAAQPRGGVSGFFQNLFGSSAARQDEPARPEAKAEAIRHHLLQRQHQQHQNRERGAGGQGRKVFRRDADTNVVEIDFASLAQKADDVFAGDAVLCAQCGACLSSTSTVLPMEQYQQQKQQQPLQQGAAAAPAPLGADEKVAPAAADAPKGAPAPMDVDMNGSMMWCCEFCGRENAVDVAPEEIPKNNTRDYVLEPPPADKEQKDDANRNGVVIFAVDISGSMCMTSEVPGKLKLKGVKDNRGSFDLPAEAGFVNAPQQARSQNTWVSRLQCVQAAVDQQIENLSKQSPNMRVGLVTFNKEVTIVGDGTIDPEVVAGDKLLNQQQLQDIGHKYPLDKPISKTGAALSKKLFALEEGGQTALGPALLVSVSMASKYPGARVVVCTDGLANVGLGSLDRDSVRNDADRQRVEAWFEGVGNLAKLHGVAVSVISIKGDNCALEDLGRVAEISGGEVSRVDPLELSKNFSSILENAVVATRVSATMLIHQGLTFRNEVEGASKATKEIGNVSADSMVTFEYTLKSKDALAKFANLKALPFQVQITFTALNGMKCLRVISQSQAITRKREEAEQAVRVDVLASNVAQQSAQLAAKGDYLGARVSNMAFGRIMQRNIRSDDDAEVYQRWVGASSGFDNALRDQQDRFESAAPAAAAAVKSAQMDSRGRSVLPTSSSSSSAAAGSSRAAKASRNDEDYDRIRAHGKSAAAFKKK